MVNQVLESLRKQSMLFADLPETVRVPGHGGHPAIDALPLEEASVDDLDLALQDLDHKIAAARQQAVALQRLRDQARIRGAVDSDTLVAIFGREA
ncbi:MAG TPA: hypothetical protein PL117_14360 [Accumulibacter sp.]|uniref:hypothetical protein n=1 Tax=Accumulibacter sp. TaxID=2053492 RepID=UPI002BD84828|nr:hypothetical protein [Accumulibacter sp.]HRF73948.1 hypothetical protein [Accumulibacter sp.]